MPDYASQNFCGDVKDDNVIAAQVSGFVVAVAIVAKDQDAVRRIVPEHNGYSKRLGVLVRE